MSTPEQANEGLEPADEERERSGPDPATAMVAALALAGVILLAILYWGSTAPAGGLGAGRATTRTPILAVPTSELLGEAAGDLSPPGVDPAASVPPVAVPPTPVPALSPTFDGFYYAHGGERILGRPIGPPQTANGREIQWLERARLEYWPEHAGTPYEVQLGRLGVEFTQGREFARQSYFGSTPAMRYFPETGHAVEGLFLAFWEQNGGLDTFGLPISEAFDEVLADGIAYRVQYFERARIEYHPELAGSPYEVQLGRLGAALLSNEARPSTIQPVPTAVPMP